LVHNILNFVFLYIIYQFYWKEKVCEKNKNVLVD
jgi:hypothetical protein